MTNIAIEKLIIAMIRNGTLVEMDSTFGPTAEPTKYPNDRSIPPIDAMRLNTEGAVR